MKSPHAIAMISAVFALVACRSPAHRIVEEAPQTNAPPTSIAPPSKDAGTLAYIGADGNVWITSLWRGSTQQLTNDATAPPEGQGRSYHRIAWSRDGTLAFAAVDRSGDNARGELFIQGTLDHPPQLVAENDEHFFIYIYGSPVSCAAQPSCPLLAYLIEEENGVGLHLITRGNAGPQDMLVSVGRPFYFSWSPDGERILWHTGGALRDNPSAEIGLYHIREDRRRTLPYAPGTFLAPAWSPRDEHWLGVVASNGIDRLQHVALDTVTTLKITGGQEITFVWSSNGRRIAYAVRESNNPDAYGPISVIDLESGQAEQVTSDAFDIVGFFWSPDNQRLAYLSRLDLPDAVWMQWRTFDLATDRDRGFTAFHPSPLMRFVVHSFNQYAQSHRFWSPDGRYLVFADRDEKAADRVWLVNTQAEEGANPILVDEGSLGVWSWR